MHRVPRVEATSGELEGGRRGRCSSCGGGIGASATASGISRVPPPPPPAARYLHSAAAAAAAAPHLSAAPPAARAPGLPVSEEGAPRRPASVRGASGRTSEPRSRAAADRASSAACPA